MAKFIRRQRQTLLAVGEGDCEVAFLKYLKILYCSNGNGRKVSLYNAQGKGPKNIVEQAVRQQKVYKYDFKLCLLDTDLTWTPQVKKLAQAQKIEMIGSTPCLEGLLLSILQLPLKLDSRACKKELREVTNVDMTEHEHYTDKFPKSTLDEAKLRIPDLNRLLEIFEG